LKRRHKANGLHRYDACINTLAVMPHLHSIHHAAIICSNYPASKAFYVDLLGLRIVAENYRAERQSYKLDLALPDGAQIELFSFPDAPSRPSRPEAQGLRHLAFNVTDVAVSAARLTALGVAVEPIRIDAYTGRRYTFFADPDGLPLELYEAPEAGPAASVESV
jgi:glyoxylase I family protein